MKRIVALASALFMLAATVAHAQRFSVLYYFEGQKGGEGSPFGAIAQGRDRDLYATAGFGGPNSAGVAFKISPNGELTALNHSSGIGGLTLGRDGSFYGVSNGTANGTVFKLSPRGSLTTLHSFTGADGATPISAPVQGADRNFYGTTSAGGTSKACSGGCGTVYRITPSGTFTTLHSFDSRDGASPYAPLVQGTDGSFYGTTYAGGRNNFGEVFKITTKGALTVLFSFDGVHGQNPFFGLIQGRDGNFYGTTWYGGTPGPGVVFKITPNGTLTVLHNFTGNGDGANPFGPLVQASDGKLYGTTESANGREGCGTLFRISLTGVLHTLYTFPGDELMGCEPSSLVQHTNGILYGDTMEGGDPHNNCPAFGCGVFFSLDADLPPFIALMPYSGSEGETIEFLGQGFTGTSAVFFNGVAADFTVRSDTYLTARVPRGATTGFVKVTKPGGTLRSNKKFAVARDCSYRVLGTL
jgi:uncharacterized repeat protein (TIGR03803 family)